MIATYPTVWPVEVVTTQHATLVAERLGMRRTADLTVHRTWSCPGNARMHAAAHVPSRSLCLWKPFRAGCVLLVQSACAPAAKQQASFVARCASVLACEWPSQQLQVQVRVAPLELSSWLWPAGPPAASRWQVCTHHISNSAPAPKSCQPHIACCALMKWSAAMCCAAILHWVVECDTRPGRHGVADGCCPRVCCQRASCPVGACGTTEQLAFRCAAQV